MNLRQGFDIKAIFVKSVELRSQSSTGDDNIVKGSCSVVDESFEDHLIVRLQCREKEMQKALAQQEKAIIRLRQKEAMNAPPDDLDLEWDKLVEQARELGYSSDTEGRAKSQHEGIVRPEFPPSSLNLEPAFSEEIGVNMG